MTNNKQIDGISIVLPVINERLNLEILIPELLRVCDVMGIQSEVLVADDGSDDGTSEFIDSYNLTDGRVRIINRSGLPRSLPDSINDGVANSQFDYILQSKFRHLDKQRNTICRSWKQRHFSLSIYSHDWPRKCCFLARRIQ